MANVKDFLFDDSVIDGTVEEQKIPKKKAAVEYTTEFVSGCDFAVTRTTAKTSTTMVIFVSRNQFYLKKSGDNNFERLTDENLTKFCADLPDGMYSIMDEHGTAPSWISTIQKGQAWRGFFFTVIDDCRAREYITEGIFNFDKLAEHVTFSGLPVKTVKSIITESAKYKDADINQLIADFTCSQGYSHNDSKESNLVKAIFYQDGYSSWIGCIDPYGAAYKVITDKWGVGGLNTFLKYYWETPVTAFPSAKDINKLFANDTAVKGAKRETEFALAEFVEYMFCECARQGFADNPGSFWNSWADYLNMQMLFYGEVKEKYTDTLITNEKILSYKLGELKKIAEYEKFTTIAKKLSKYEYVGKTYCIVAPKTAKDVISEGTQQSNCVASYVPRIAEGEDMIFFMRKTSAPDKSLVTVEVYPDGTLGQVKGRFNKQPRPDELAFVKEWHRKFFCVALNGVA